MVGSVVKHVPAKSEGPAGKAGSVNAQLITDRRSRAGSCAAEGGNRSLAGHLFKLLGRGWRPVVAKLSQPVLVVIQDFHRTVGGEAKALTSKQREYVLGEETGEEIILFFFSQAVFGMVNQFVHVKHSVSQLIGRDLILIANHHIRDIRGVQDGEHLVEDITIAASVFGSDFDAVFVGIVEVVHNFLDCGFAGGTGVLMPPHNFLGWHDIRPGINLGRGFGRGFSHNRGFGRDRRFGRSGNFCCFGASAEQHGGNQDDCH